MTLKSTLIVVKFSLTVNILIFHLSGFFEMRNQRINSKFASVSKTNQRSVKTKCWNESFDLQNPEILTEVCYYSSLTAPMHTSNPSSQNPTNLNQTRAKNTNFATPNHFQTYRLNELSRKRPSNKDSSHFLYQTVTAPKTVDVGDRIINGYSVNINNHPWTVYLYICPAEGNCALCAGTIIATDAILTAKHCVEETTCAGSIYAGSRVAKEGEKFDFSCEDPDKVILNPDTDLAIIKVQDGEAFSQESIAVPTGPEEQPETNEVIYVLGWGRVCNEDGKECSEQDDTSDTLQGVDITVAPSCPYDYPYFCAGGYDSSGVPRDACVGDSGGPAECKDDNGGVYLCGVVSNGPSPPDCGKQPGGYIRLADDDILEWLYENADVHSDNRRAAEWESSDQYDDLTTRTPLNSLLIAILLLIVWLHTSIRS